MTTQKSRRLARTTSRNGPASDIRGRQASPMACPASAQGSSTYAARMRVRLGMLILISSVLGLAGCDAFMTGQTRPTEAVTEGYVLEYARGAEALMPLVVDKDAEKCLALRAIEIADRTAHPASSVSPQPTDPEPRLYVACVLATNIDVRFIVGEAFGRLNEEDTPAFEAIIWRARLEAERSVCESAGLLGARLDRCHAAVDAKEYRVTDGPLTVVIAPSPTAAP